MVCIVSAAGRVHAVAKVSLCPFDTSDRLPRPSVATTSRYVRLRACNTIVAHSSSLAGVNTAESSILPLEPSCKRVRLSVHLTVTPKGRNTE